MKNTLKKFTIWTPNKFGMGCIHKKAKDFTDAFSRISMSDKMKDGKIKDGWITDEDGDSKSFNEICGIEETI